MSDHTPHGFASVEDLLVSVLGDESIRDDLRKEAAKYIYLEKMLLARTNAGLSQEQIAEKMGVSQSTISRIECSADEMVTALEMRTWFTACGMSVRFEIDAANAPGYSPAELLKAEVHRVEARLKALESLAKQMNANGEILRHFESFRGGALFQLLALADPPKDARISMAAEPKPEYKTKRGKKKE